jgi:YesN/AraC family two-component response regulator
MVAEIIQEILHRDHLGECFLTRNNELFCIFNLEHTSSRIQIIARLERFFSTMSKNVKNYFNKYVYMTVSKSFIDLQEVKSNFNEVKKSSGYIFYINKPCILWVDRLEKDNRGCPEIAFNSQNIFTDRWMSDFEDYISSFFKARKERWVSADELKIQVVRYVNELSTFMSKFYNLDINHVFPEETQPNYFNINSFANADGLRDWLIKTVKEVRAYVLYNERKEATISKIKEYATENYNSNITLTDIAEKFHMNSVYVCQLFRKKTGVTFTCYMNRLRIEKAKGLLLTTSLTIEQISEKVGVRNNNYFFRLFKKSTGQTVNQFRKSLK